MQTLERQWMGFVRAVGRFCESSGWSMCGQFMGLVRSMDGASEDS